MQGCLKIKDILLRLLTKIVYLNQYALTQSIEV